MDLPEKLRANECRRIVERLILELPPGPRTLLSTAPVTSENSELPPIYFPTWKDGRLTTTRGDCPNWLHRESLGLTDLEKLLTRVKFTHRKKGYFFFGDTYPFFSVDLSELQQHLKEILSYTAQHKHPDIVLVSNDSGIIIEFGDNGYEMAWWGL